MKLGLSFNIFNGKELLYDVVLRYRDHVDYINIVLQEVSNHNKIADKGLLQVIDRLVKEKIVDEVYNYTPNLSQLPKDNETTKRNIGLELARKQGCTHFITADGDEFYEAEQFEKAKEIIIENDYEATFAPIRSYYKTPSYYYDEDFYVPFIYKINEESKFDRKVRSKALVDSSRKIDCKNFYIFKTEEITMHHLNYVREDLKDKLTNASANRGYGEKINRMVHHYNNWTYPDLALILYHAFTLKKIKVKECEPLIELTYYNNPSAYTHKADNVKINEIKGISIVITAFNSAKYLDECLSSIQEQTYFKTNDKYEIHLGIDGCINTLNKALEIQSNYVNLNVYFFQENKGTYVTKNSLIEKCKYENILFFDIDDVMTPNMIEKICEESSDIIRFGFYDFEKDKANFCKKFSNTAKGAFMCKEYVLKCAGGFNDWKCAADYEFQKRTEQLFETKKIYQPLFYRRVHNDSLTRDNKTGIGSNLRETYHKQFVDKVYDFNSLYINPKVNSFIKMENKNKIPKIIHQVWIGDKKPPVYMNKWQELNPDYKYMLWDNEAVGKFVFKNKHLIKLFELKNDRDKWNGICDVIRYEILYHFGGIYLDADCEPIRKLDDFLLEDDFFTCYLNEQERQDRLASGIIGATKNHKIMFNCIEELSKLRTLNKAAFITVGPVFFTEVCKSENIKVYPSHYFLPHFFKEGVSYKGEFISYCNHHWGTTKNLYEK